MCTPDTLDKLNSLISQASDTISCDANCQQQRKADQLKQKYLDAQTNLASAPNQLNTAQKLPGIYSGHCEIQRCE